MASPDEVREFVAEAANRDLPEMTTGAAARLRPFDLSPLREAGERKAAIVAMAFADAALAVRGVRLAALGAPVPLRGEVADRGLNDVDVAVGMAAAAARAVEISKRSDAGVAPDPMLEAFAGCDCWPL